MDGVGAQEVPGLVLACWWMGWILGLVPAHWWVELDPGVSGDRALGVQELMSCPTGEWV